MNIELISGSPRQESITFRLALFLQKQLIKRTGHNVNIVDVREWEFPTLQEVVYSSADSSPDHLKPLVKRMFEADAFILVSPEYNGSYTTPLKNLLDHFPKQMHKPFGIVTASPGALGGIRAALQLQLLICALFGIVSPFMLVTPLVDKKFAPDGELLDPSFEKAVDTFITEFLWLAERIRNN